MFNIPVLFLVFNRPELTKRVFEQIRKIRPASLYIAADGPRPDKPGEDKICIEVKNIILTNIDWDCEVKTLFRERNLGCGKAVSEAITWFFEHVEEGIILEDDCLPDLSFFYYCTEMLSRYKAHDKVMHIGGNNFQFGEKRGGGDYYYSILSHIWGWATWRKAWNQFEFILSKSEPISEESYVRAFNNNQLFVDYYKDIFQQVSNFKIDTWDYQWLHAIIQKNGYAVTPGINLVENIGFGIHATHTLEETEWNKINKAKSISTFIPPDSLLLDFIADTYTLEQVFGITGNSKYHLKPRGYKYSLTKLKYYLHRNVKRFGSDFRRFFLRKSKSII